jgi:hypothetical protein
MSKIRLYVAVPSTGTVSDIHSFAFRQFEKEYGDKIEFIYPKHCVHRKLHDFARNSMVEDFLASEADIMWFLDSDVVPPPNVLDLITKHGEQWELAGAPYPVFMTPAGYAGPQVVMCVYTADEKGMHARSVPYSGTNFVDGMATGCIFIKREVFAQLEKPYFEFKYNPESREITEGEDLGFCMKVNALGYKFFTDFSMVCGHYKNVNLTDVNNYAISYAQQTLDVHHANLKEQALAAVKAAYAKGLNDAKSKPTRAPNGLILPDHLKS